MKNRDLREFKNFQREEKECLSSMVQELRNNSINYFDDIHTRNQAMSYFIDINDEIGRIRNSIIQNLHDERENFRNENDFSEWLVQFGHYIMGFRARVFSFFEETIEGMHINTQAIFEENNTDLYRDSLNNAFRGALLGGFLILSEEYFN